MKNRILIFVLFLGTSLNVFSQKEITTEQFDAFLKIPQEKIVLHFNSNFLLTGETLNYKVFCLETSTNNFSSLSKIAYIELIDSNLKTVVKQKIALKNGEAQGDIFINTDVKSGNYKLIAYTEWMKNANQFYKEDVNIINPFSNKIKITKDSIKQQLKTESTQTTYITLDKNEYSRREKVILSFKENRLMPKNASISVRKLDIFSSNKNSISKTLSTSNNVIFSKENSKNKVFLPDFRGELLQGKITSKTTNTTISNIRVGISFIGENELIKITNTDKNGKFYFYLDAKNYSEEVYVHILEDNREKYEILMTKNKSLNLDKLVFNSLNIDSKLAELIDKRSKYIQIENAYTSKKKHTVIQQESDNISIFENDYINYDLDDYTRFKTIQETMVEILKSTWINKKGSNYTFHVKDNSDNLDYYTLPILFIDGYIVQNHNELISLNPKNVKTISISRNVYQLNSKIYQGVISVKTFKKDYTPIKDPNVLKVNYKKPLPLKDYFSQSYSESDGLKRIPDYRVQLLWNPNLDTTKKEITFFTSDVTGSFEIDIQGFNDDGKPIAIKKYFTVK